MGELKWIVSTQHKLKEPVPIWKLNSKEGKNLKEKVIEKG